MTRGLGDTDGASREVLCGISDCCPVDVLFGPYHPSLVFFLALD